MRLSWKSISIASKQTRRQTRRFRCLKQIPQRRRLPLKQRGCFLSDRSLPICGRTRRDLIGSVKEEDKVIPVRTGTTNGLFDAIHGRIRKHQEIQKLPRNQLTDLRSLDTISNAIQKTQNARGCH